MVHELGQFLHKNNPALFLQRDKKRLKVFCFDFAFFRKILQLLLFRITQPFTKIAIFKYYCYYYIQSTITSQLIDPQNLFTPQIKAVVKLFSKLTLFLRFADSKYTIKPFYCFVYKINLPPGGQNEKIRSLFIYNYPPFKNKNGLSFALWALSGPQTAILGFRLLNKHVPLLAKFQKRQNSCLRL